MASRLMTTKIYMHLIYYTNNLDCTVSTPMFYRINESIEGEALSKQTAGPQTNHPKDLLSSWLG